MATGGQHPKRSCRRALRDRERERSRARVDVEDPFASPERERVQGRFQEPVRLLDIGITPGESTHADTLSASALPHRIEALITMDDGHTATTYLTLDQGSGFQHHSFQFANVTEVRLTLRSAYGTSAAKQVAISEIEFFGPSHSDG